MGRRREKLSKAWTFYKETTFMVGGGAVIGVLAPLGYKLISNDLSPWFPALPGCLKINSCVIALVGGVAGILGAGLLWKTNKKIAQGLTGFSLGSFAYVLATQVGGILPYSAPGQGMRLQRRPIARARAASMNARNLALAPLTSTGIPANLVRA